MFGPRKIWQPWFQASCFVQFGLFLKTGSSDKLAIDIIQNIDVVYVEVSSLPVDIVGREIEYRRFTFYTPNPNFSIFWKAIKWKCLL
jgi:hypothetical protein